MKSCCITIRNNKVSEEGFRNLYRSHKEVGNRWELRSFDAITPEDVDMVMRDLGIRWDYPDEKEGPRRCPHTGLLLHPYRTPVPERRIACFASHAELWFRCATSLEPMMIFEDDAQFVARLAPESILSGPRTGWGCIFFNDPRGATRRPQVYHGACVNAGPGRIIEVPWVDNMEVPQGGPGNSAYYIEPWAAKLLLQKAREVGGRPNDSLMCKQYFPWLGQSTSYFTKVSGRKSGLAKSR